MTILVIGGTGRVGAPAIQELLAMGQTVRCMSRSADKLKDLPAGVEGVVADLDDPSTLAPAFEGVTAMMLSQPVVPLEEPRGMAALDAAQAAGVRKVVMISLMHYPGSESRVFYKAKQAIEQRLKTGPFDPIIIRPANFFQADVAQKPYVIDQGVYAPPIGSIGVDWMDARDVGIAAARALAGSAYDGQEIELYGPERHTGDSVAAAYAKALNRPVRYQGDDIDHWVETNRGRLGEWYIDALRGMYQQQQTYGMRRPDGVPQHPLLPERLRTMDDYAREMREAWLG